jgi:hypothetical protein
MPQTKIAPYGSWKSPITSDLIVAGITMLSDVRLAGDDICWLEGRPREQGRNVIVRASPDSAAADITPAGFNVRTRAHEYGGGSWLVAGGTWIFSNFADQRLYRQRAGQSDAEPLTPAPLSPMMPPSTNDDRRHHDLSRSRWRVQDEPYLNSRRSGCLARPA